jgi:hypothetical protein
MMNQPELLKRKYDQITEEVLFNKEQNGSNGQHGSEVEVSIHQISQQPQHSESSESDYDSPIHQNGLAAEDDDSESDILSEDWNAEMEAFLEEEGEEFIPFSAEEISNLKSHARAVGTSLFIEEHVAKETPLLKLFHAFGFPYPFDDEEVNPLLLFAKYLKVFCNRRVKLPHLNSLDDAVTLLKNAKNVIVLSGAGISVSCGIPDFRSENGLYSIISGIFPI